MLVGALVAAAFIGTATPPAGTVYEPVISARASWVAGQAVSIYCAPTDDVWQGVIAATGDVPPGGITNGITPVGGTVAYLAPQTCAPILTRLDRRTPNLAILGAALDVLTVESLHIRGELDDGQTACDAIAALPTFLVAKWGFRKGSPAFRQLMYGARNYLSRQSPQYHSAGC